MFWKYRSGVAWDMKDFTLEMYGLLLSGLRNAGYTFTNFESYLHKRPSSERVVVLRHDVDKRPHNALKVSEIENQMGIQATYYFRSVKVSFNEGVIKKIDGLGHEIGYHYENLSHYQGNYELAIKNFESDLKRFRNIYPVKTICMHGSPLSKWDNRDLWKQYDYRDYGIIGEPYLDIDFEKVFYLTDTGRRWDGDKVSVRDKVKEMGVKGQGSRVSKLELRKTKDIIEAAERELLPDKTMINTHPQRWTDNPVSWVVELVEQNIKNQIKKFWVS